MNDNHELIAVFLNAASFPFCVQAQTDVRQPSGKSETQIHQKIKSKFQMNIK